MLVQSGLEGVMAGRWMLARPLALLEVDADASVAAPLGSRGRCAGGATVTAAEALRAYGR
jgi:hypothetical protein